MKGLLFILFLLIGCSSAKADQLAYLSKLDADKAVECIVQYKYIYLFCGCCDDDVPRMVQIKDAYIRKTGYEDFYEVVLKYSVDGEIKEEAIDLAYTWVRKKNKFKTIGALLHMEHDICRAFPN
jgi:hypothetical protein